MGQQASKPTDENRRLYEVYQNTTKELQQAKSKLEEQLEQQKTREAALKSKVENLEAEVVEKPLLQNSLKELQTKSAHCEEESRKLAEANIKLKEDVSTYESKQSDLEAKYSTTVAEKDESVEQLQAAKRTIEDLKQQHFSQGQKLQSQISSLMDENRLLNEVRQNTKKELQQVIFNLEEQPKEQKAGEAALKSEVDNLKAEAAEKPLLQNYLKELQTKSAHFDEERRKLAEANIKLKEDVSTYESKQSDLEAKYSTAVAEKDESVEQLQAAKRIIEDLKQQHSSQGQKLQSQISSLTDENNLLNEVHQNTKKELQQAISNLEEQLKEQKAGEAALKSEVENLKAEVAEKTLLQNSLNELQTKSAPYEEESRKLAEANIKLKEDVSTYESKQSDLEAKYSTAVAEKDESVEQLQAAKRTIEDLMQQHSSQWQKLESQISSLTAENMLLNEVHQNTKKELQQVISNLEGQLKEQKAGEVALRSELKISRLRLLRNFCCRIASRISKRN
ncbi:CAP-Gly domain-containing linker protein 1-like [Pyrus x bretschneideri]|uniref:CAP-Gly domain-containing linker protein 1-like n=1 Tax=Pyrus x bretschneideri TaxID=225117 RepID=UPI00202F5C0F|nr:CAP-Gly domain-containing linker protein 1-like [Pyrus x bretschneideri]XP_048434290.1 CAP-Gly domain-containing linker protein 1-like [Pyrus x bretschneideri]XP_048434291.1 CAP-Gly domain-containing linker protein 1-like [Pyrus x bretschneideri]XP_048434292.1 CAP-Gly domain-containing linker protein 1-like [Pyrus x bretschneideri]